MRDMACGDCARTRTGSFRSDLNIPRAFAVQRFGGDLLAPVDAPSDPRKAARRSGAAFLEVFA